MDRLSLCLVSHICSSWSWILDWPVSGARGRCTGQSPPAAAADRGRCSSEHRGCRLHHPTAWGMYTGTDPVCQAAAGCWCTGEFRATTVSTTRNVSQENQVKFLGFLIGPWLTVHSASVSYRWMLVTLMVAPHCVTPVQPGALSVWNCCWSMEQQLTLRCLPSHLFMRHAWEVRFYIQHTNWRAPCLCASRYVSSTGVTFPVTVCRRKSGRTGSLCRKKWTQVINAVK